MIKEALYSQCPIPLQNLMCSFEGFRLRRKRYTERFHSRLDFLMKSRYMTEAEMALYQVERLNDLLRFATKTVPYYRNLLQSGQIPAELRTLADLQAFPVLNKEVLRDSPATFVTEDTGFHYTVLSTSGSTGTPLRVVLSEDGLVDIFAMLWRQRTQFGVQFGDETATFNGRRVVPIRQTRAPFWRRNLFLKQTLFSQYHTSNENLTYYYEELSRHPYLLWFGYPSFIGLIATFMERNDLRLATPPRLIQTGSETLLPGVRERIVTNVQANLKDNYGCTEGCVSISECEAGKLHVDREMCIVEVEPIQQDARHVTGHLIVTGLSNQAMPLIRYRIGDIGTMSKFDCTCGRVGPVFERIDGRIEDCIITPNGYQVGRMDHLLKGMTNIAECQIVQTELGAITLNIVRMPAYTEADEERLAKKVRGLLGEQIRSEFNYVNAIPRLANGKFRAVVSDLKPRGT